MPRVVPGDEDRKFVRYRHAAGKWGKVVRFWVRNPHSIVFQQDIINQSALLLNAPEEEEALNFIESVMF